MKSPAQRAGVLLGDAKLGQIASLRIFRLLVGGS